MGGNSEETKLIKGFDEHAKSGSIFERFWELWRWFVWKKKTPQKTSIGSQITQSEPKPLESNSKPISRPKSAPIDIPKRVQQRPRPDTHHFELGHHQDYPNNYLVGGPSKHH